MAENGEGKSGKSRFLSKSKWGKVLREREEPAPPGHTNSFKLNEDVVDFLKPSTDKSTRPKINIAVASRWPEAHEVRRTREASPPVPQLSGYRKPRRRPGLKVAFVKAAPDIIGEGGDEAPDPPSEISRQKSMIPRSVSDRRPSAAPDGTQWSNAQAPRQPPRQASPPDGPEEKLRPQPVRRVQTSHNELSPPIQRKHASAPLDEPAFHKPSLSRTPTGFNSQDEHQNLTPTDDHDVHPMPHPRPSIDTRVHDESTRPRFDSAKGGLLSASPREPASPAMRKQRDMQASEGMALRRASAMYMDYDDQDQVKQANNGFQPPAQFYNALSEPTAPKSVPEASPAPAPQLSPDSAVSPDESSPFADPKYLKRRSREVTPVPPQPAASQSLRQPRTAEQPSYMRAAQQNEPRLVPVIDQPRPSLEQPSYMRAVHQPRGDPQTSCPPPAPSTGFTVSQGPSPARDCSPMRDCIFDAQAIAEKPKASYSQPNHSSGSVNQFASSPKASHTRTASREETSPQARGLGSSLSPPKPQPHIRTHSESPVSPNPRSLALHPGPSGMPMPSPYSRGPSPADYFSGPRASPGQPARSPAVTLRQEDTVRPGSSGSARSAYRPAPVSQPPAHGDATADTALADFAERVAHMKGVFRLTAEKERSADRCSPQAWLRAGLWWYLRGKAGLENVLQQRPKNPEGQRELLMQPHVDLAKAWWVMSDPLQSYATLDGSSPHSAHASDSPEKQLQQSVALLQSHLQSLCVSMLQNRLMPPHQSLIQGQDTSIWLKYPRFTSDAAAVLGSNASKSLAVESPTPAATVLEALPLGDTRDSFCYGRFPVEVSLNTDDAETDRVVLPCILTMLRGTRDYQTSIGIASQSDLVSVKVGPRHNNAKGLTWHEVSWKASSQVMVIHLPRGFDLTVRLQERDFRSLWNVVEYARKVEHSLRPESGEHLVHEARLAELQYVESSGAIAFPQEKLRSCMALVFERTIEHRSGSGVRKMHRGFRLLLVTDPSHKSLSSVSHQVCRQSPLLFEFLTDAAANGTTAMVLRVREESKHCRMLLVFPDTAGRQGLYDILNGLTVGPDETIVGKMTLASFNIQAVSPTEASTSASHPALQALHWQKLGVTNSQSDDPNTRIPETVESDNLRIVARHAAGCITDRLNLGKGELLLRLACSETPTPTIQVLRNPQEDLAMSVDTRQAPQHTADGVSELLRLAHEQATIRTYTFATSADLHAFQTAITRFTVRYDGVASTFGISRRRMVVPIYHKWQASKVRLQVVYQNSITQVLAFMEDFSHADALCFKVMSTDTFESVKGDSKGKKWAVKMVDAKFTLPKQEKGEVDPEERTRRRFVNLEGLDYAEEHDDITIGFDTEEDRDKFAQALPAVTTRARGLTLKRRI
ncbi:hypothetical protein LTR36_009827 [Oleoguttula mirabilis]|uniref:Uncharacterized protein n=1 Tax=Oleoguttula mirabilis TaxID=1507867 RepID=A0AAV9J5P7_9PEZI|nr:hypothetical protein LTR36_009827 [Oleoguttula mirabilis]